MSDIVAAAVIGLGFFILAFGLTFGLMIMIWGMKK